MNVGLWSWTLVQHVVICGTMWPPALILCCLLCKQASESEALLVLSGVEPRHFTIILLSGELLIAPAVATGVHVCVSGMKSGWFSCIKSLENMC